MMAPPVVSATVLLRAATAMAALLLQLRWAAAAARPSAPINGQPGCATTCGNVSVPYPFGYGPSHCYWPGLNLTCDTTHHPPRLLLGIGGGGVDTLRVTEISLENSTVRVMRAGVSINTTGDMTSPGWTASLEFGRGFRERGYLLSARNELVVSGCNAMATLSGDIVGEQTTKVISGCASVCTKSDLYEFFIDDHYEKTSKFCTGTSGCCLAPLTSSSVPKGVEARWLDSGSNHTLEQSLVPVLVFVAEQGWVDMEQRADGFDEAPLLLDFGVLQDLPPCNMSSRILCTQDVQRMVCKSEHSYCSALVQGYACSCEVGYEGNAYLAGGCQDTDECKIASGENKCFGVCTNTIGSYDCGCPLGTYGRANVKGGCVKYNSNKDQDAPTVAPVPTGMPNCSTTCGDVSVPYPFGFGHPSCYLPGFNLTCDTNHSPPRLLLDSNGTLQVGDISLRDSTVHVIHHHHLSTDWVPDVDHTVATDYISSRFNSTGSLVAEVNLPHIGEPYVLSTRNEFILFSGWDVRATLHGEVIRNGSSNTDSAISSCVSSSSLVSRQTQRGYCSGSDGCCRAAISEASRPKRVKLKALSRNISHSYGNWPSTFAFAFISEVGLTHQWNTIINTTVPKFISSPIVLQWAVKQGLPKPAAAHSSGKCLRDVFSSLCKSDNSFCRQENAGFTCHCSKGYDGNPYVVNGCQDINECNIPAKRNSCLGGYCNNLPGRFECRCPRGTHGNASEPGGCEIRSPTGLIIGLSVATGPVLLLLVMGTILLLRKFKQRQIKVMKQKYFRQNRGQLLQQLVSQKADIAERMIIPLDELAKATNNFDKARELGGGGHGTVYKGILSDLHVVAIKKSKITVQKEIDEFINEVAILSQINHKNVVKLFGCCLETEVPLLVYEFISNGTLYHHLHVEGPRSLPWSDRLRIATEIATSLAYLHSSVSVPIIHRDIKSSNILIDDTMTSKISDFGASKYVPVDKTGLTTRVQGTIGYLDPIYFYTGRLTEKSDVYSFGVILVELLTRKKPFSYLSTEGDGLVSHFVNLLSEENLVQILDPQVIEEGGKEVQEVAALAATCINLRGEERPTMRQVEHKLHGLQGSERFKKDGIAAEELENIISMKNSCPVFSEVGKRFEESSRIYSLEQEVMLSARYPR